MIVLFVSLSRPGQRHPILTSLNIEYSVNLFMNFGRTTVISRPFLSDFYPIIPKIYVSWTRLKTTKFIFKKSCNLKIVSFIK